MTLEDFYYISQIISTVALVISLVYLGLQTRQTGKNQIAQMHQARSALFNEYTLRLTDPELGRVAQAGFAVDSTLTDEQLHRFYFFSAAAIRFYEEIYREWRDGMIGHDRWNTTQRTLSGMLRAPGYRATYGVMKPNLDLGFVELADSIIKTVSLDTHMTFLSEWKVLAAQELQNDLKNPP